ncbi:ACP phosphodiesterase [Aquimonas voraii]|uniref:Acyl carrier protein phosphodiesterase n=1 Tax=Aquimonas voraii TaxID=265719 RepID=A0A1G6RQ86_9GAMM|nr:ACP phosphodiesterase [Aquimonas voraii]SDD06850.1 Acyl carrier protein phosphodiesterase [Aquimonas voraii]
MNYLAHLLLAEHSDEGLLGALLGDFVAGSAFEAWPAIVRREILIHRRIDGFTDRHPQVLALKAKFPEGQRRYAGILIDVYFDHLLARDWPRHEDQPLHNFSQRVYRVLAEAAAELPPRLAAIAPLMASGDWLGSYRLRDNVDRAVTRIARRLSRGGEGLVACLPTLRLHEAKAEAGFEAFFPELRAFVDETRAALMSR